MAIVYPIAPKAMIPRRALHVLAPVLVPVDVGLLLQHSRAFPAHIGHAQEGPDIHPNAIVQVRIPAEGLLLQWLPADEDIVRGLFCAFAFQYQIQTLFQRLWRVLRPSTKTDRFVPIADQSDMNYGKKMDMREDRRLKSRCWLAPVSSVIIFSHFSGYPSTTPSG